MSADGPAVLLVDDEPRLRTQLAAVLADYGVMVVGEAGTGREGVDLARRLRPDVVLMDLRMPDLDGIAATRLLSESLPSTADRRRPPAASAAPADRLGADTLHA